MVVPRKTRLEPHAVESLLGEERNRLTCMSRHTRKGLYLAGAGILIAVGVVLAVALPPADEPLQATFDRYAIASDGSTRMAVLTLSNLSEHTFQIYLAGPLPPEDPGYFEARYTYTDHVNGTRTNWMDSPSGSHAITIPPSSMMMVGVPLTSLVDVRRVGVWCLRLPSTGKPIDKVKAFVMRVIPAGWRRVHFYQAWCPTDLSWREAGLASGSQQETAVPKAQPVDAPE